MAVVIRLHVRGRGQLALHKPMALGLVLLVCALAVVVSHSSAAEREASDWRGMAGKWRLDPAHSAAPDTAISRGLKGMFFLMKPIAKGKVHKHLDPAPELRLALSGDTLTLLWGSQHHPMVPGRGQYSTESESEGRLEREDRWTDGALESSNRAREGTMIYRFVLEPGGRRMELTLTLTSPRLNGPVSGSYVYVRE
jgi:hypothetical protein